MESEFRYTCDNCLHGDEPINSKICKSCDYGKEEKPSHWRPASIGVAAEEMNYLVAKGFTFTKGMYECMERATDQIEFELEHDAVNHPKHYCREGAIECFEEFEIIYGPVAAYYAALFNLHKYRYRAADKNGQQDIQKSDWYMRKVKELKEKTGIELEISAGEK